MYAKEKCVMLLAHLFDKYDPKFFNDKQWIIMDNGAFENSKVSNDLEHLVDMAENSPIPIKEIVIPDVMGNEKATLELFMNNFNTITKWQRKYKFMFVAHSNTEEELDKLITMFNKFFAKCNLSIGIPKRAPYPRDGLKAANVYGKSLLPIHLLGLKCSFDELLPVKNVVRSCDSSQIAFSDAIRGLVLSRTSRNLKRYGWQGLIYSRGGYGLFNVPVSNQSIIILLGKIKSKDKILSLV